MDLPRQLKHVDVHIVGGDPEDRAHWARLINGYLQHQPCVTQWHIHPTMELIKISPDANND